MMSRTVLLVEDDIVQIELYSALIRAVLPEVKLLSVTTAEAAIELLTITKIDLVIVDLLLAGEKNGIETVQFARAQQPHAHVIILTGDNSPETEELIHLTGVDAFAVKPVKPEQLISLIKTTLIIY